MIHKITMWWCRKFVIIEIKKAIELKLRWYRNVYGDEINHLNCRSLWVDNKNRIYRIRQIL